jgi:hypothetical protein
VLLYPASIYQMVNSSSGDSTVKQAFINGAGQPLALVIDNSPDRERRRQRIDVLKEAGYKVYPAREMKTAEPRALSGAFQLVLIHEGDDREAALRLCDRVRSQGHQNRVVLLTEKGDVPVRDYVVLANPENLREHIREFGDRREGSPDMQIAA